MPVSPAQTVISRLQRAYPTADIALSYDNPLELLIATILSAQCTDKKVNEVTPAIFKKYRTAADYAKADRATFEQEIRATGFYRNKAKHIIGAAQKIEQDFTGKVPQTMEGLLSLPGVARKTANIVLYSGFGISEGIAVDTHVRRLSQRLGLTTQDDPPKIEQDLMALVPKKDWGRFSHLLIEHGRAICGAKKPLCPECVLKEICPSRKKFYP